MATRGPYAANEPHHATTAVATGWTSPWFVPRLAHRTSYPHALRPSSPRSGLRYGGRRTPPYRRALHQQTRNATAPTLRAAKSSAKKTIEASSASLPPRESSLDAIYRIAPAKALPIMIWRIRAAWERSACSCHNQMTWKLKECLPPI